MLFLVSLIVRAVARVLVLPGAADGTKDLEILVLGQQLRPLIMRMPGRSLGGLPEGSRGAPQAGHPMGAHHHPDAASGPRPWSRTHAQWLDVERVPPGPGLGDHGL